MHGSNKEAVAVVSSSCADIADMDPGSSTDVTDPARFSKRPNCLNIELLTITEENIRNSSDVHLGFRNISYSFKHGLFLNKSKKILKEVNGDFYGSELTAIMGPSGAGKTTLMKILAGYTINGVTGELTLNQETREESSFRRKSCFIMQDDNLHPLLTVYEAMMIAAHLKFNTDLSHKEKQSKIKEILDSLGLSESYKVRTKSLSGGQKKRLSIALELLKDPQVMFFDEPTSGLDSSTTKQCIMLLKQLAQEGRTVVCNIHQPSAIVFEMFDNLYAMADGYCIYQGAIKGLIPYLSDVGLHCPTYHNPADYLLEVAAGDYGNHVEILKNMSANGMNQDWRNNQRDTLQLQSIEHIDKMAKNGLITPVKAPPMHRYTISQEMKRRKPSYKNTYSTSFLTQLFILIRRTMLITSRDKALTYNRITTHVIIAMFIGVLYYGIGSDASDFLNNYSYIYFTCMFLMYTAFSSVTTTFPTDFPILIREHFNRWYSLKSYFLAIAIADIPIQTTATLLYSVPTYFMTSQPLEPNRIFLFLVMCILISFAAQGFGFLIGALMGVQHGAIFGPFAILPFTIFSGFFITYSNAHPYLRWLFHTSFLKYGFEGLMLSIFGYERGKMPCNAEYCHFLYPEKFLGEVDMENAKYDICVYFLIAVCIGLRYMAFLSLKIKLWWRT